MNPRLSSARGRRSATAVVLLLGLSVLAACGGSDGGATAATTASAAPAVSCPAPQTTTTAGAQRTVQSGGDQRTYNVWLPTGYDGTKPVPLVVDFHGAAGNSVTYETGFSSMGTQAPARGYLLVAPQGVQGDASAIGWKSPGSGTTPDDVQFVADLLKDVAANYCVDPSRQYATGFSSGAAFTTYLSCRLDTWAAVAPLAGVNLVQPCVGRPAVPLVTFHGTTDTFVPYTSSVPASVADPNAFYLGDVKTVVDQFAVRNGCQPTAVVTDVVPTVKKTSYTGCRADVELYTIEGAGHTYPGGKPVSQESAEELGGQSDAIDAGKTVLDFFDAHRRSTAPVDVPAPWAPGTTPATPAPAASAAAPAAAPVVTETITAPAP